MKSFGAKVKEQRGNLGLSQKQLAEKAGMGIRTITSYELGERKPYQHSFINWQRHWRYQPSICRTIT